MDMKNKKAKGAQADPETKENVTETPDSSVTCEEAEAQTKAAESETNEAPKSETASDTPDANSAEKAEEKKEEEDLKTQYLRLAADFQNFRKRVDKERSDIYARANENLMADLLPVLDDFERALAVTDENAKSLQEGVRMIVDKYTAALKKHGLSEMEAQGAVFDPNVHHAVQICPAENGNSGTVVTVLQKGYLLNGKVLRPAMVIVAE